jgi:N-terminal half of MaoC dehydratase
MAADFALTDEMRSVIGIESDPYPTEFTSTGIRGFARGVGYTDPVYFDVEAAKAAGYANLPAPPTYLGIPVFIPGKSDPTYGQPTSSGGARLNHGLANVLDGGTTVTYARVPIAGDTLLYTSQISNLEVKESKSLGRMLVITSTQTYRDGDGHTVATVVGQSIWY